MLHANSSRLFAAILLMVVVWAWVRRHEKASPLPAQSTPPSVAPGKAPGLFPDE